MNGLCLLVLAGTAASAGSYKAPAVKVFRPAPLSQTVVPYTRVLPYRLPESLTPVNPMGPVTSAAPTRVTYSLESVLSVAPGAREQAEQAVAGEGNPAAKTGDSVEKAAAGAGKLFDGSGEGPDGPVYVPPEQRAIPGGELPHYLSVADPDDRAWLTDVINVSLQTKTGVKVLEQVEALSLKMGRPVTVVVATLRANNGEYVYDWGMVRMASHYRKKDAWTAAPIMMHELLHVVQVADNLPVDAVEMELEAFIITLRMIRELGLRPKANSFEDMANRALRKSGADFVKYVTDAYSANRGLSPGGIKGYVAWLEGKRKGKTRSIGQLEKKLAKERLNLEAMRAAGQPAEQLASYEKDRIGDLERRRQRHLEVLIWMDRDLALLSTEEGREHYRRFAKRVRRMVRNDQGS